MKIYIEWPIQIENHFRYEQLICNRLFGEFRSRIVIVSVRQIMTFSHLFPLSERAVGIGDQYLTGTVNSTGMTYRFSILFAWVYHACNRDRIWAWSGTGLLFILFQTEKTRWTAVCANTGIWCLIHSFVLHSTEDSNVVSGGNWNILSSHYKSSHTVEVSNISNVIACFLSCTEVCARECSGPLASRQFSLKLWILNHVNLFSFARAWLVNYRVVYVFACIHDQTIS